MKIDAKVIQEMVDTSLQLLQLGDIVIFKDAMYYEKHTEEPRELAESLYSIFKKWAIENNSKLAYKNFYRVYFSALSKMNANQQVSIVVGRTDLGIHIMKKQKFDSA